MRILIKSIRGGWSVEVHTPQNEYFHFEVQHWSEIWSSVNQRLRHLGEQPE